MITLRVHSIDGHDNGTLIATPDGDLRARPNGKRGETALARLAQSLPEGESAAAYLHHLARSMPGRAVIERDEWQPQPHGHESLTLTWDGQPEATLTLDGDRLRIAPHPGIDERDVRETLGRLRQPHWSDADLFHALPDLLRGRLKAVPAEKYAHSGTPQQYPGQFGPDDDDEDNRPEASESECCYPDLTEEELAHLEEAFREHHGIKPRPDQFGMADTPHVVTPSQPATPRTEPPRVKSDAPSSIDSYFRKIFAHHSPRPDVYEAAGLFGAIPGGHVHLRPQYDGSIYGTVTHPQVEAHTTSLLPGKNGEPPHMHVHYSRTKGVGTHILAEQVRNAVRLGLSHFSLLAARGGARGNERMVGYKVWPKFGYDAPLSRQRLAKLPEHLKGATTVQELLAMPGGEDYWSKTGRDMEMRFDLTPGSKSLQLFNRYLAKRGIEPIGTRDQEHARHFAQQMEHARQSVLRRAQGWGVDPEAVRAEGERIYAEQLEQRRLHPDKQWGAMPGPGLLQWAYHNAGELLLAKKQGRQPNLMHAREGEQQRYAAPPAPSPESLGSLGAESRVAAHGHPSGMPGWTPSVPPASLSGPLIRSSKGPLSMPPLPLGAGNISEQRMPSGYLHNKALAAGVSAMLNPHSEPESAVRAMEYASRWRRPGEHPFGHMPNFEHAAMYATPDGSVHVRPVHGPQAMRHADIIWQAFPGYDETGERESSPALEPEPTTQVQLHDDPHFRGMLAQMQGYGDHRQYRPAPYQMLQDWLEERQHPAAPQIAKAKNLHDVVAALSDWQHDGHPQQHARGDIPARYGRWITLGARAGADGVKKGGSPVYIEGGKITKGAPGLAGRKLGAMHEDGEGQDVRAANRTERNYQAARLLKEARQAGLDPAAVRNLGQEMLAHDAELHRHRSEVLREARSMLGEFGNTRALHIGLQDGRDPHSIKGIDEVADAMKRRHPHLFPHDRHAEDVLGEMLTHGAGERMTLEDAYRQAIDTLHLDHIGEQCGHYEDAVPFSRPVRHNLVPPQPAHAARAAVQGLLHFHQHADHGVLPEVMDALDESGYRLPSHEHRALHAYADPQTRASMGEHDHTHARGLLRHLTGAALRHAEALSGKPGLGSHIGAAMEHLGAAERSEDPTEHYRRLLAHLQQHGLAPEHHAELQRVIAANSNPWEVPFQGMLNSRIADALHSEYPHAVQEFLAGEQPARFDAQHAPTGGTDVGGKHYPGGEFVPGGESGGAASAAAATPRGRKKLTAKEHKRRQKVAKAKAVLARAGDLGVQGAAKAWGTVEHAEHVAKEWVADRVDKRVSQLPANVQGVVRGVWQAIRLGSKALFATYTAGQSLAEEVAIAKGSTPEQAARLRGILQAVDVTVAKPLVIAAEAAHLGEIGWAMGLVPVASTGYLAYSLAKDPVAVMQAARATVRKAMGRKPPEQHAMGDARRAIEALLAGMDQAGDADLFAALVCAALDDGLDLAAAVELAKQSAGSDDASPEPNP